MKPDVAQLLRSHGIQPSAQRVAIATFVLATDEHPSADQVWTRVTQSFPMVSRATVYNTLHTLVEKGLLRQHVLAEGRVVFDPFVEPHHHLIDAETGRIHDVPWDAIRVSKVDGLEGFDVDEYQVVLRGRRRGSKRKS